MACAMRPFAGARLPAQQHRGVGRRDLRHLRLHLAERRRRADEPGKLGLFEHLVAKVAGLVAEPLPLGAPGASAPTACASVEASRVT